jgi:hypothetical protein
MPPRNARFGRDLVCDLDARNFGKPRAENTQVESFCRREFVDKVEGFGEADAFASDEAKAPMDLARIHPALRVSGWRPTTLSGGVGRWKGIDLATFRVDCLAIGETELVSFECSPL